MKLRFLLSLLLAVGVPVLFLGCDRNDQEDLDGIVFIETVVGSSTNCIFWQVGPDMTILPWPTIKQIDFKSKLKKTVTDTRFLDVKINDAWVEYRRIDGGTIVPRRYHSGYDILVPANGSATLNGMSFMSPDQLTEPPFDALFPENGGVDPETGSPIIRLEAKMTWYGQTYNGDKISSTLRIAEDFSAYGGCNND